MQGGISSCIIFLCGYEGIRKDGSFRIIFFGACSLCSFLIRDIRNSDERSALMSNVTRKYDGWTCCRNRLKDDYTDKRSGFDIRVLMIFLIFLNLVLL